MVSLLILGQLKYDFPLILASMIRTRCISYVGNAVYTALMGKMFELKKKTGKNYE